MQSIDLNCDMGEGMPTDKDIFPFISSANIACGYHAGDLETMRATVALAKQHDVAIGAHPGFKDKENFGRKETELTDAEIYKLVIEQIRLLKNVCIEMDAELHHVKPHGALYNMAARNKEMANAIANAVYDEGPHLQLYGLSGSLLITEADKLGLITVSEVFADRTYQSDGTLTPRSHPQALITNEAESFKQVMQMLQSKTVTCLDEKVIPIIAESICLHGDGEHAVTLAKTINRHLQKNNIDIATKK